MKLDYDESEIFTDEEMRLINRMSTALRPHRIPIRGTNSNGQPFRYEVVAVVEARNWSKPMQINFKALNVITSGLCMIGPQQELNDDLFFAEEEIKYEFFVDMEKAAAEFQDAMARL